MSQPTPPIHENVPAQASLPPLHVLMAAPRGFCAGVRRAIEAVEEALRVHGPPVYVRRAIVHNGAVVRDLEAAGAIFVEELSQVPEGAVTILSAHGVPRSVVAEAVARKLRFFDAVCPLVAKVHREVRRHHRSGRHVLLIGHAGHPEIVGTLGQLPAGAATVVNKAADVTALGMRNDLPVAYAVQTTYSMEEADAVINAIEARFADVAGPSGSDICYATSNRQGAMRSIVPRVDAMIVAGEHYSSNASRLAEVAAASGCGSVQLIADPALLDWERLGDGRVIGLTAAASTPEATIDGILQKLRRRFSISVEEVGHVTETAMFRPVDVAAAL